LPPPQESWLPTINIARAHGWPGGQHPKAAEGLKVEAFATALNHPRWLYVLPNGDILVAETNRPTNGKAGIYDQVRGWFLSRAGAGAPSANRITLLRDADRDGKPEVRSTFLKDLKSPFGMALIGDRFYVANADAIMQFPYKQGQTEITEAGKKLTDLPGGPRNHHWTKSLIASRDGAKLYVGVGSNSNVAENGMDEEKGRAAIWEIDVATGNHRVYASGLRNPVGIDIEPTTGALWAVVNERDEIGDDVPPDYLTSVKEGGFYGWPYSYWGKNVDDRVKPQRPDLVATAITPDYAVGAHTASLGLTFAAGSKLPAPFTNGAFIGQHGSWNRKPHSGYQVIFIPFENGKPNGDPVEVLTGFLSADEKAYGRPVGVTFDKSGALLVADDVGNVIWRVTGQTSPRSALRN
jgi:glucose/arabinose dehydrogenase